MSDQESPTTRGEVAVNAPEPEAPDTPEGAPPDGSPDDGGTLGRLEQIIESVLFAAAAPVSLRRLVEILDGPAGKEVQAALARLQAHCGSGRRGIQLQEVAGGYQLRTARENAEWVRAVFRDKPARLGRAALETLAIVAYKQPVTRAEVEVIRGVDVDGVLATLLSRRLIKISGRKEAVGRPLLYSTTAEFLETFGLKDVNELPSLKELGSPDDVRATTDNETPALAPGEDSAPAATSEAGEPDDGGPPTTTSETAPPAAADDGGSAAAAEASEPCGDGVTAQGGGADPGGTGAGERAGGDRAGDESDPPDGPDHG